MIPMEFAHILQMKVSMDRIREFLKETELDKYGKNEPIFQDMDTSVGFKDGKFVYQGTKTDASQDMESSQTNSGFYLRDLEVIFPSGKLSVICGSTGSGKTSLILSLLGELQRIYHPPSYY